MQTWRYPTPAAVGIVVEPLPVVRLQNFSVYFQSDIRSERCARRGDARPCFNVNKMRKTKNLIPVIGAVLLLIATGLNAQDESDNDAMAAPLDQVVPVANEVIESVDEFAVAEPSDHERLIMQFQKYKQLMNDGVYDEADSIAKLVVELAIRVAGPTSTDTAKALTNLGIVQHRTKQYDSAQQNYQSAIEIIEDNEDRLSRQLINPLKGLGAAQLDSGRPDLASGTFRRAVHITHVNDGPHNLGQVDILESLAEASLRLGTLDTAKEVQDVIYALNLRYYAKNSLELVPALMKRALWQHRAGLVYDERTTYRRVIRIIEESANNISLDLVEPLTKLGQSFFYIDASGTNTYQSVSMTTGEIYFKRALRIAQSHPDSNWQIVADATLALADYYMYQGNEQRARKVYRNAWDLMSEEEQRLDYRYESLEQLVTLKERPIPQYVNEQDLDTNAQSEDLVLTGLITVSYTVTTRGRATDLKIVEAVPPDFVDMLRLVQREMRRRIFRPRFEESGPVESPNQLLIHRFFYKQSDLDAIRSETESAKLSNKS